MALIDYECLYSKIKHSSILRFRIVSSLQHDEPDALSGDGYQTAINDPVCEASMAYCSENEKETDEVVTTVLQHSHSSQSNVAAETDDGEQEQSSTRKTQRLSLRKQANATNEGLQLLQGDAETLDVVDKELESKQARRSLRTHRQLKKQMSKVENYIHQKSEVDSPRQQAVNNSLSSQQEVVTHDSAAEMSDVDEKHSHRSQSNTAAAIDDTERDQNLMRKSLRLSRQKQTNANAAVTALELETNDELQLLQGDAEMLHGTDKELEPKRAQRSSRTRGQQKQQMNKMEKCINIKSDVDRPRQHTSVNSLSFQQEVVIRVSAAEMGSQLNIAAAFDGTEWDRNLTRKSSRLSQQKRVNANATALKVETSNELQLQQGDTETLHDSDKELEPKQAQRRLLTRGQKKQMIAMEKLINQKSEVDSPRQQTVISSLSSQQEVVTHVSTAEISDDDEKVCAPESTQRNLRTHEHQKKQTKKSRNQKAKVDTTKPDTLLSSFQQAVGAYGSAFEASEDGDKQLKPKTTQMSLRTREQLRKQIEKSVGIKRRKLDSSGPKPDVFSSIPSSQQEDNSHTSVSVVSWTSLHSTDVNKELFNSMENGNLEGVLLEDSDKNTADRLPTKSRSASTRASSVSTDSPVHCIPNDPYENHSESGTSLSMQNAVGFNVKAVMSSHKKSSSADLQKDILSNQSEIATETNAVDNSQCSSGVTSVQKQSTDTVLISISSHAATSGQNMDEVQHRNKKIPQNTTTSDNVCVGTPSFHLNDLTPARRAQKHISSMPGSFSLSSGVIAAASSSHTEISHTSTVDFSAKTMMTKPTVCSIEVTEAQQRINKVTASIPDNLDDEDEQRGVHASSLHDCHSSSVSQHEIASQNSSMVISPTAEAQQRIDRVMALASIAGDLSSEDEQRDEDARSLHEYSCIGSDIHENVNQHKIASQQSSMITSGLAHILPAVDSFQCDQRYSGKGLLTVASGSTRIQGISDKVSVNELTCEKEDLVADQNGCSQPLASQQLQHRNCAVTVSKNASCFPLRGSSQDVDSIRQMQQQIVQKISHSVDYTSQEVNEIPGSLPEINSQIHISNAMHTAHDSEEDPTAGPSQTSQQLRRQKCSVADAGYSFSLYATQIFHETQQVVADADFTSPEVNKIPSSLPPIQSKIQSNDLQKQSAYVSGEDPVVDHGDCSQISQALRWKKCSVPAYEYSYCSQASQVLHETQHDYPSPEMNEIPNSLPQIQSQVQCSNELQKQSASASVEDSALHCDGLQTSQRQQRKCSVAASGYRFGSIVEQDLSEKRQQVVSAGVDYTSPEVNEIPSSLPWIHSQIQSHDLQKQSAYASREDPVVDHGDCSQISQALRWKKCSVPAYEYSYCSQASQVLLETQHDYPSPEMNEIPNSLPQIQSQVQCSNELQKQSASASVEDSALHCDGLQTSQRQQQKCSVAASGYSFGSIVEQDLRERRQQVASAGVDFTSPEVNDIPSSGPPTHSWGHWQKQAMSRDSSVAATDTRPMVSVRGSKVDAVGAGSRPSLPDVDSHRTVSGISFASQGSDTNQRGGVAYGGHRTVVSNAHEARCGGGAVKVSQAVAKRQRIKVSYSRPIWVDASEQQADDYDEVEDEQ